MTYNNQNKQDFQDPKIILTSSILRQRDSIVSNMNNGNIAEAFKCMATLMSQLDIDPEKKELLKARDELTKNYIAGYIPSSQAMFYFQLINDYLNLTYFADYHSFKFQNPKPKHIGAT